MADVTVRGGSFTSKRQVTPWTRDECDKLCGAMAGQRSGNVSWATISQSVPGRTGKQCREKWSWDLRPHLKKGSWTPQEDYMIALMLSRHGTCWEVIAQALPMRSANAIKNNWNTLNRGKSSMHQSCLLKVYGQMLLDNCNGSVCNADLLQRALQQCRALGNPTPIHEMVVPEDHFIREYEQLLADEAAASAGARPLPEAVGERDSGCETSQQSGCTNAAVDCNIPVGTGTMTTRQSWRAAAAGSERCGAAYSDPCDASLGGTRPGTSTSTSQDDDTCKWKHSACHGHSHKRTHDAVHASEHSPDHSTTAAATALGLRARPWVGVPEVTAGMAMEALLSVAQLNASLHVDLPASLPHEACDRLSTATNLSAQTSASAIPAAEGWSASDSAAVGCEHDPVGVDRPPAAHEHVLPCSDPAPAPCQAPPQSGRPCDPRLAHLAAAAAALAAAAVTPGVMLQAPSSPAQPSGDREGPRDAAAAQPTPQVRLSCEQSAARARGQASTALSAEDEAAAVTSVVLPRRHAAARSVDPPQPLWAGMLAGSCAKTMDWVAAQHGFPESCGDACTAPSSSRTKHQTLGCGYDVGVSEQCHDGGACAAKVRHCDGGGGSTSSWPQQNTAAPAFLAAWKVQRQRERLQAFLSMSRPAPGRQQDP